MSSAEFARVGLPATIGPYRVVRELGRGGMGLVYEAVHTQLGKRVAIKTLRSHLLEDDANVQRFVREGRAACHIHHPHVVEIYELGTHEGAPYLVMDLLEGVHLGRHLEREGPIPLEPLIDLMLPIVAAVSAAHAAGVVHRDLKPSNIMLARGRDGGTVPKVLDFGTSKLRGQGIEDQLLTITGAVLGTLHYMSPEQTRAPKDADARSDQYSLGLILYECATGEKPFTADSVYDVMQAIMTAPIAPPSTKQPALPKAFDAVVLRAMSRRAHDRYGSVAELGVALLPLASSAARKVWEAELTNAIASAPSESLSRPIATRQSNPDGDLLGTTLPESAALHEAARRKALAPASPRRKWGGALGLLAIVLAILAWSFTRERDTKPSIVTTTPAKKLEPAAPAASSTESNTFGEATNATSSPVTGEPRPLAPAEQAPEASKKPEPSKPRRPGATRVRLGDNGAPILE